MAKTLQNTWRIVRQDTHGTQVVQEENLCETAAKLKAQKLEDRIGFHHQTVWTDPMTAPRPELVI
jgi:hypothetical protein